MVAHCDCGSSVGIDLPDKILKQGLCEEGLLELRNINTQFGIALIIMLRVIPWRIRTRFVY